MTEEQKKRYQDFFEGKHFDDLTDEEKKFYEESLKGKVDEAREALAGFMKAFSKTVQEVAKHIAKAFSAFSKQVNEEAEAGNTGAQYVKYRLELATWENRLKEVEGKLAVTRKTTARKPLLEQKKRYKAKVEELTGKLQEVEGQLEDEQGA